MIRLSVASLLAAASVTGGLNPACLARARAVGGTLFRHLAGAFPLPDRSLWQIRFPTGTNWTNAAISKFPNRDKLDKKWQFLNLPSGTIGQKVAILVIAEPVACQSHFSWRSTMVLVKGTGHKLPHGSETSAISHHWEPLMSAKSHRNPGFTISLSSHRQLEVVLQNETLHL